MKYRNIVLAVILLIVLMLAGCACEHEWMSADCLNPQTCEKCGEVGEPALDHDWLAATCTDPQICRRCGKTQGAPLDHDWINATCLAAQTCSRCSETQGDPLGHSYGSWSFGESDMTHTCIVCAFTETVELDHELYLETVLPGHWDYYGDFSSGELEPASSSNIVGLYLSFGDCHSVTLKQATLEAETGTWEFEDLREADGTSVYYIDVILESVTMTVVLYHDPASPDDDLIAIFQPTFTPVFSKNTAGVSLITGNWGIAPNKWNDYESDRSYWLTFHDDRTVTCNFHETFEGIWHVVPMTYSGYVLGYGVAIEYDNGGETQYIQGTLMQENLLEAGSEYRLSLKYSGDHLYLAQVSDDELEAIKNSTNRLLGKWTSCLITDEYWGDAGTIATDYSITFHEDGSFTADLGQEYTGTWDVDSVHTGSNFDFGYSLYFHGQKEEAYCHLETNAYGEIELIISSYPGSNDKYLHFAQISDEEAEAISFGAVLPIGTWTAHYYTVHDADGSRMEDISTEGYSITFHEDGTFTALLDKEVTGAWSYNLYDDYSEIIHGVEHIHRVWDYNITFHGESTSREMIITTCAIDDLLLLQIDAPHPKKENSKISYSMTKSP